MLLMGMWLAGRRHKINLYGLSYTLERMKTMWDLFDWRTWPGFFDIDYHVVAEEELALVLSNDEIIIQSSPVKHFIPTLGLRIDLPHSQKVITYSCDTEPCPAVTRLAQGADWLIHEAAGASTGHSSAAQAAEVARQAGQADCAWCITQPKPRIFTICRTGRRIFAGKITTAEDFSTLFVG
jgi:ribonuclease Z